MAVAAVPAEGEAAAARLSLDRAPEVATTASGPNDSTRTPTAPVAGRALEPAQLPENRLLVRSDPATFDEGPASFLSGRVVSSIPDSGTSKHGKDQPFEIHVFSDPLRQHQVGSAVRGHDGSFQIRVRAVEKGDPLWVSWRCGEQQGHLPTLTPVALNDFVEIFPYQLDFSPSLVTDAQVQGRVLGGGRSARSVRVCLVERGLRHCRLLALGRSDGNGRYQLPYLRARLLSKRAPRLRVVVFGEDRLPLVDTDRLDVLVPRALVEVDGVFERGAKAISAQIRNPASLNRAEAYALATWSGIPARQLQGIAAAFRLGNTPADAQALYALHRVRSAEGLEEALQLAAASGRVNARATTQLNWRRLGIQTELRSQGDRPPKTPTEDSAARRELFRLAGDSARLLEVAEARTTNGRAEEVAALGTNDWLAVVAAAGAPVPPKFGNGRDSAQRFARDLMRRFARARPEVALRRVAHELGSEAPQSVLDGRDVRRFRSLHKILDDPETHVLLEGKGIRGASNIIARRSGRFAQEFGSDFDTPEGAHDAYLRARSVDAVATAAVVSRLVSRPPVGGCDVGGGANALALPGPILLRPPPQKLFKSPYDAAANADDALAIVERDSSCVCSHDLSAIGPAAYLFDLLSLLGRFESPNGESLLSHFRQRRPDVPVLLLSSANVSIGVPTIDLVNELLMARVESEPWTPSWTPSPDSGSGEGVIEAGGPIECGSDGASPGADEPEPPPEPNGSDTNVCSGLETAGTTEERRVSPQSPPTFRLLSRLSGAAYPWSLPYRDEDVREGLLAEQLDLDRAGLALFRLEESYLAGDAAASLVASLSTDYIGANQQTLNLLLEVPNSLAAFWGPAVAHAVASGMGPSVANLLRASGMSFERFEELLTTEYVSPARLWKLEPSGECDLERLRLRGNKAELCSILLRLHRLERLTKLVNWPVHVASPLLTQLGGGLTASALAIFGGLRWIQDLCSLSPEEVALFVVSPSRHARKTIKGDKTFDSPFEVLYGQDLARWELPSPDDHDAKRRASLSSFLASATRATPREVSAVVSRLRSHNGRWFDLPQSVASAATIRLDLAAIHRLLAQVHRRILLASALGIEASELPVDEVRFADIDPFIAELSPNETVCRLLKLLAFAKRAELVALPFRSVMESVVGPELGTRERQVRSFNSALIPALDALESAKPAQAAYERDPRVAFRRELELLLPPPVEAAGSKERERIIEHSVRGLSWLPFFGQRAELTSLLGSWEIEASPELDEVLESLEADQQVAQTFLRRIRERETVATETQPEDLNDGEGGDESIGTATTSATPQMLLDAAEAMLVRGESAELPPSVTATMVAKFSDFLLDEFGDSVAAYQSKILPELQDTRARLAASAAFTDSLSTLTGVDRALVSEVFRASLAFEADTSVVSASEFFGERSLAESIPTFALHPSNEGMTPPRQRWAEFGLRAGGAVADRLDQLGSDLEASFEVAVELQELVDHPDLWIQVSGLSSLRVSLTRGSTTQFVPAGLSPDGGTSYLASVGEHLQSFLAQEGSDASSKVVARVWGRVDAIHGGSLSARILWGSEAEGFAPVWSGRHATVGEGFFRLLALATSERLPASRVRSLARVTGAPQGGGTPEQYSWRWMAGVTLVARAGSPDALHTIFSALDGGIVDREQFRIALALTSIEFEQLRSTIEDGEGSGWPSDTGFWELGHACSLLEFCREAQIDFTQARRWYSTPQAARLSAMRHALRRRSGAGNWLEEITKIEDVRRVLLNTALTDWLVGRSISADGEPALTEESLAQQLCLADLHFGPCHQTTRVQFAYTCVQNFVNWSLLCDEIQPVAVADMSREWEWRRDYRLWEANRRIFVHPENWLQPDQRAEKSELFVALEDTLSSGPLDGSLGEKALLGYLRGLAEVANLEVVAVAKHDEADSDARPFGFRDEELVGVHVFARTRTSPRGMYYRRRRADRTWTPWEKMPVELPGTHYVATVVFGKVRLIAMEFEGARRARNRTEAQCKLSQKKPADVGDNIYNLVGRCSWIDRHNDEWSPISRGGQHHFAVELHGSTYPEVLKCAFPATAYDSVELSADRFTQVRVEVKICDSNKALPGSALGFRLIQHVPNEAARTTVSSTVFGPSQGSSERGGVRRSGWVSIPENFDLEKEIELQLIWAPADETGFFKGLFGEDHDDLDLDRITVEFRNSGSTPRKVSIEGLLDTETGERIASGDTCMRLDVPFEANWAKILSIFLATAPNILPGLGQYTAAAVLQAIGKIRGELGLTDSGRTKLFQSDEFSAPSSGPYTPPYTSPHFDHRLRFQTESFEISEALALAVEPTANGIQLAVHCQPTSFSGLGVAETYFAPTAELFEAYPEGKGTWGPGEDKGKTVEAYPETVTNGIVLLLAYSAESEASLPLERQVTPWLGGVDHLNRLGQELVGTSEAVLFDDELGVKVPTSYQYASSYRVVHPRPFGVSGHESPRILEDKRDGATQRVHFAEPTDEVVFHAFHPIAVHPVASYTAALAADPKMLTLLKLLGVSVSEEGASATSTKKDEKAEVAPPARRWKFSAFHHAQAVNMARTAAAEGIPKFLAPESQRSGLESNIPSLLDYFPSYQPTALVDRPYPSDHLAYDTRESYAQYNWEAYLYGPLLIAQRLSDAGKYDDAERWFRLLLDPGEEGRLAFQTAPLRYGPEEDLDDLVENREAGSTAERLQLQVELFNRYPYQPHYIAQERRSALRRAVVMRYLDHLIAHGDSLFRRAYNADRKTDLKYAALIYNRAARILGERPEAASIGEDPCPGCYDSLASGRSWIDDFMPVAVEGSHAGPEVVGPGLPEPQFCLPENEVALAYWDELAERFLNLRNCRDINGVERALSLYGKRIDPALLVRAATEGIDFDVLVDSLSTPVSRFRYKALLAQAIRAAERAAGFGQALIASIEKAESEELALLRSEHEQKLLTDSLDVRKNQAEEAHEGLEALLVSREQAEARLEYYSTRQRENSLERAEGASLRGAAQLEQQAARSSEAAADWAWIPSLTVAARAGYGSSGWFWDASLSTSYTLGGETGVKVFRQKAEATGHAASQKRVAAARLGRQGSFLRRWEDWELQAKLARKDVDQLSRQINAAEIRLTVSELELENHRTQLDQSRTVHALLKGKFSSAQLYRWMETRLNRIYYQQYRIAHRAAQKAQRSMEYELGSDSSGPIRDGWKTSKRGASAAEELLHELERLDERYEESRTARATQESTLEWSLCERDPLAFLRLKYEGKCRFELREVDIDWDEPGTYYRRITRLGVTAPGVVGPGMRMNWMLTQQRSVVRRKARTSEEDDYEVSEDIKKFTTMVGGEQLLGTRGTSATTSRGASRGEELERFEGTGLASTWSMELPVESNYFDRSSLSDIVLSVEFECLVGGPDAQRAAVKALDGLLAKQAQPVLVDLRSWDPDAWHEFTRSSERELRLGLTTEMLPLRFRHHTANVRGAEVYLEADPSESVLAPAGSVGRRFGLLRFEFEDAPQLSSDLSVRLSGSGGPPKTGYLVLWVALTR